MTASLVNGEPIYSSLSADPVVGELVEAYVGEMPERISAMEQAFANGTIEALRTTAHQMKGAAGSYGFEEVTRLAAGLDSAIRGGEPAATIRQWLDDLIQACRRIRPGVAPK